MNFIFKDNRSNLITIKIITLIYTSSFTVQDDETFVYVYFYISNIQLNLPRVATI